MKDALCAWNLLSRGTTTPKASPEGFVPHVAQVAAALSAAVTTTKLIGDTPTLRRNQARRSDQPKRQPLFGRRGLGRRGFSQRSRLPRISPHISHPQENFLEMLDRSTGFVYNIICLKQKRARFSPCDLRCWADGKKVFV